MSKFSIFSRGHLDFSRTFYWFFKTKETAGWDELVIEAKVAAAESRVKKEQHIISWHGANCQPYLAQPLLRGPASALSQSVMGGSLSEENTADRSWSSNAPAAALHCVTTLWLQKPNEPLLPDRTDNTSHTKKQIYVVKMAFHLVYSVHLYQGFGTARKRNYTIRHPNAAVVNLSHLTFTLAGGKIVFHVCVWACVHVCVFNDILKPSELQEF